MSMEATAAIANPWTERIVAALQRSVEAIFEVGRLLRAAKEDLPHGEFQLMIERDLPFTPRQAQAYMRVAACPHFKEAKHASLFPPTVNTLEVLGRLSAQEFARRLGTGEIHPNMSRRDAQAMLKSHQTNLFEDAEFFLSGTGQGLEREIEQDKIAPHWLQLNADSRAIIEEFIAGLRKLKRSVNRLSGKNGPEAFQAEFYKMETRVTELADKYRRQRLLVEKLLADAERSLQRDPSD